MMIYHCIAFVGIFKQKINKTEHYSENLNKYSKNIVLWMTPIMGETHPPTSWEKDCRRLEDLCPPVLIAAARVPVVTTPQ